MTLAPIHAIEVFFERWSKQDHHGDVERWLNIGGERLCTTSDGHEFIAALVDANELPDMFNDDLPQRVRYDGGPGYVR